MIGDAIPHESNKYNIEWKKEVKDLKNRGINIYSIQCLNDGDNRAKKFWRYMAEETNGLHLYLDQFNYIVDIMLAVCLHRFQGGDLENYENELNNKYGGMSKSMRQTFNIMLGRQTIDEIDTENNKTYSWSRPSKATVTRKSRKPTIDYTTLSDEELDKIMPCAPSRFQVIDVDTDRDIQSFSTENDLTFRPGTGFYQFSKPELIQKSKEIILQEKSTGLFFEGMKARKMLNLIDYDDKKRIKCTEFPDYNIFIQSTSYTRILKSGTKFLYDTCRDD